MTPPTPTRDTPAGQAYNDLRNLARRDGRDPAEYITLYALEGFLARLAVSEYAGGFVLKGGVLMAAFAARRPTRDIDFAATGLGLLAASICTNLINSDALGWLHLVVLLSVRNALKFIVVGPISFTLLIHARLRESAD